MDIFVCPLIIHMGWRLTRSRGANSDGRPVQMLVIDERQSQFLKWCREKPEPQIPLMAQITQIKIGKPLIGVISVISVICGSDSF